MYTETREHRWANGEVAWEYTAQCIRTFNHTLYGLNHTFGRR